MTIALVLLTLFKHVANDVIYPVESNRELKKSDEKEKTVRTKVQLYLLQNYKQDPEISGFCANNNC